MQFELFLGQIILVPWSWTPQGFLPCNGQLLAITQYQALFSLLGTTYGGDGSTTFALPNLNGRAPVGQGTLWGTSSNYQVGTGGGSEHTTLTLANLPAHTHTATFTSTGGSTTIAVTDEPATQTSPVGNMLAKGGSSGMSAATIYAPANSAAGGSLAGVSGSGGGTVAIDPTGGGAAAYTRSPFLVMNYLIATDGIYPIRA